MPRTAVDGSGFTRFTRPTSRIEVTDERIAERCVEVAARRAAVVHTQPLGDNRFQPVPQRPPNPVTPVGTVAHGQLGSVRRPACHALFPVYRRHTVDNDAAALMTPGRTGGVGA